MKYFAYTDEVVKCDRAGNVTRETTLYSVKNNVIRQVASRQYQYEADYQSVMRLLEEHKLLPERAFERGPSHGYKYMPYMLKDMGIANIQHI